MKSQRYKSMATLCLLMAIISFIATCILLFFRRIDMALVFALITLLEAWQYCLWRHKGKMREKGRPKFDPFTKREAK
jgi:hypothetical protein